MGNAEPVGDPPGVVDVLAGAAGAGARGRGAVVVELERDPDDVIAALGQQRRRDRAESTPPDMATTTRVSAGRPGRSRAPSISDGETAVKSIWFMGRDYTRKSAGGNRCWDQVRTVMRGLVPRIHVLGREGRRG